MKLSLFTPTHKPTHLRDTFDSIQRQNYQNWEWVIAVNGGAKPTDIPTDIRSDGRVRVFKAPVTDKIGHLKNFTAGRCTGDVLIEMDHDDMLVPGALRKIAEAAEGLPLAFLYSDAAVFEDGSHKTWGYSPNWGWEHDTLRVYGQNFTITKTFDITPRSLCEVYVAPDHVRAWTRKAYEQLGGHDVLMSVCDDHDLLCRTYLAGIPFVHVGGCQYLYRWHPANTIKSRQAAIKKQNDANRKKYMQPMIAEWLRRKGYRSTNLLDMTDTENLGHIHSTERLQFLDAKEQVVFFNSAFEALLPGGYLTIDVPSPNSKYADQDARTVTRFNDNSFRYYTDKRLAHHYGNIRCRFQLVDLYEHYPSDMHKDLDMKVLRAEMCVLKGQRHPGPVYI